MDFINYHERYHNIVESALGGHCSAHTIDLNEDRMLMRTIAKNGVGGIAFAPS